MLTFRKKNELDMKDLNLNLAADCLEQRTVKHGR